MKTLSKRDCIVISLVTFLAMMASIPLLYHFDFITYIYTTPSGQISQWEYTIAYIFILTAILGWCPFIVVAYLWLTE